MEIISKTSTQFTESHLLCMIEVELVYRIHKHFNGLDT